jgi:hypothetical protein
VHRRKRARLRRAAERRALAVSLAVHSTLAGVRSANPVKATPVGALET